MARGFTVLGHSRLWRLGAPGLVVLMMAALTGIGPAGASVSPGNAVGVGSPPTGIAVNPAAHTAYVVTSDSDSDQVAVLDTAACTAHASAGCTAPVATVALEAGAQATGVAFDAASKTVYVADAGTGDVSMINASTCSAVVTSGCATAPTTGPAGLASPAAVAADTSGGHNVVYVADSAAGAVTVFSGTACSATVTTGCATTITVPVGAGPRAFAVDSPAATVYVANGGDSSVSTLSEAACSAMAAKCSTVIRTVPLGAGQSPAELVADPADQTVFIADAGTGDVSFLDASRCSVGFTAGCSATPRTMAGLSAAGVGFTTEGDVTVADSARNRIVSFSATTCDATTTVGCTALEVDPLTGSPGVVATSGVTVYAADAGHDSVDIVATPSIVVRITSAHRESSYGWYRSAVTVGYVCTAGSATLASKCPGTVRLTKDTSGRSFGAALIANDGGRVATGAFVRIDMTKPTVRVTGVVNGKRYAKGHHPSLHCVVLDSGSGPAACKITISQHGFHGRHRTYTGTAADKAGNVKRVHGRFTLS